MSVNIESVTYHWPPLLASGLGAPSGSGALPVVTGSCSYALRRVGASPSTVVLVVNRF